MKVAILGANGFIAKRFAALFSDEFDQFVTLDRKHGALENAEIVEESTRGIDVLIHAAFDHDYKHNILGIHNVLRACTKNKIQKLVYLSTMSVYSPDYTGVLNEEGPYSVLKDPYTKEKQKAEKILAEKAPKSLKVIVLQPAIVYGLGGNWTKFALHAAKAKSIYLPKGGETICNAVYVDDVVQAIYRSCLSVDRAGTYLISGEVISWKYFYQKHAEMLQELSLPNSLSIKHAEGNKEFHHNSWINLIFIIWFKTPLSKFFELFLIFLKRIRAKKYSNMNSPATLVAFLHSPSQREPVPLIGVTRKVHEVEFQVSSEKAIKELGYFPQNTFDEGINLIKRHLRDILE